MSLLQRIATDPEADHGNACIKGTRVTVAAVLDDLAAGKSHDEILNGYPELALDDIRAAVAYAAELARDSVLPVITVAECTNADEQELSVRNKAGAVIRRILDKLVAGYEPEKVILFGSYAYGHPRPDSDLDLLIIKETPERSIDRRVAVRRVLTDPKRKVPLEILVLTPSELSKRLAMGDQFIEEIIEKGVVLYGV